jgi:hypothetical protein
VSLYVCGYVGEITFVITGLHMVTAYVVVCVLCEACLVLHLFLCICVMCKVKAGNSEKLVILGIPYTFQLVD